MNGLEINSGADRGATQPRRALAKAGFEDQPGRLEITDDVDVNLTRFLD